MQKYQVRKANLFDEKAIRVGKEAKAAEKRKEHDSHENEFHTVKVGDKVISRHGHGAVTEIIGDRAWVLYGKTPPVYVFHYLHHFEKNPGDDHHRIYEPTKE